MDVIMTENARVRLIDYPEVVGCFRRKLSEKYAIIAWPWSVDGLNGAGDLTNLFFVELVPATTTAPESGPQWGKGSTSA